MTVNLSEDQKFKKQQKSVTVNLKLNANPTFFFIIIMKPSIRMSFNNYFIKSDCLLIYKK
jgi:hypothetical protein